MVRFHHFPLPPVSFRLRSPRRRRAPPRPRLAVASPARRGAESAGENGGEMTVEPDKNMDAHSVMMINDDKNDG